MACRTSVTRLGWDWHQRPARSFHHLYPGLISRRRLINCFPLSLRILAPTWLNGGSQTSLVVETSLVSLRGCVSSSTFMTPQDRSPPPSASAHPRARSHLPVTITGRTNGLIQGHPARSVSLRQSCAQLCVKNGSWPPSEWAGLVGANCRGFVNARRLPQKQRGRQALALEMPGGQAGRLVKAGDRLPPGHQPPPPHLSSAELGCGGGIWLPSSCTPGQVPLRKGLWISSPGPWEPTHGQPCLMDETCSQGLLTSC